ncbi:pentapeptide repeat-containing protein [uncultured Gimesia sp.]|uniref:pentapeptide repeat-containing protein n=1 Tax=uncultured Gimesia sp. TaxID=1678688 RepID=UPI0030DB2D5E|tara:strand:+ start:40832 stop:42934 length:2103 start_codon:yes stop_codon:yes gene_type:complete
MANPVHVEIVKQGAEAIRKWRESNKLSPTSEIMVQNLDLSGADLRGTNLSRANLSKTNLQGAFLNHADLRGAELTGADLSGSDLSGANLSGANFVGATMTNINLVNADLSDAILCAADSAVPDFTGAKLRHANFGGAIGFKKIKGLEAKQLGGVNLRSVDLPASVDIKSLESMADVSNHVKYSRTLFLTLIIACMYSWLTMWSASDANIITNNSGLTLPIVNVSLPVTAFFWVTPCIVLAVYAYFLLYFQQLLERLSLAPAVFPDGKTLDEQADPWIILSFIRRHLSSIDLNERDKYQYWLIVFLVWWIVPITLVGLWQRYLVTHNLLPACWIILWCLVSIEMRLYFYRLAISTISGSVYVRKKGRWSWLVKYRHSLSSFLILVGLSLCAKYIYVPFFWRANLEGAELNEVILRGCDLQKANMYKAIMNEADLSGSDLNGADLRESSLNGTDLSRNNLEGADLSGAHLEGASFRGADLKGAYFIGAHLEKASFESLERSINQWNGNGRINENLAAHETRLEGAVFSHAYLQDASFSVKANLNDIDFSAAHLEGARLGNAHLERSDFSGAYLEGADLAGAHLEGANFSKSHMRGANLWKADLKGANLSAANLEGARLTFIEWEKANLASAKLEGAIIDTPDWIEDFRKHDPSETNFDYKRWSIEERKNQNGDGIYVLVGPAEIHMIFPQPLTNPIKSMPLK